MANLAARNSDARDPVPLLEDDDAAAAAEEDKGSLSSPPMPSAPVGRPVAGPTSDRVTKPAAPRPRPGM